MNELEFMTLHADESGKEVAKEISSKKFNFCKLKNLICKTFACAIIFLAQSCSQDESDVIINSLSENDMYEIASHYFTLSNDQYILNLSEKTALRLDITKDCYDKIINAVLALNIEIEDAKKDPNRTIILSDPSTGRGITIQEGK
jgi:hypothetical protein